MYSPGMPTSPLKATMSKEDFWREKLTFTHSTFGSSSKQATLDSIGKGEGYRKKVDCLDWIAKDHNGNSHARMRIALPVGRNTTYNPDYKKNSIRESVLNISLSHRFPDHEKQKQEETIKFNKTIRKIQDLAAEAAHQLHVANAPKKKKKEKKKKSELSDISVDDIQKALLPGW